MLIKRTDRQARRGHLAAALATQSQGALNRRTFLGDRDVEITYDPLEADPDYLIVGPRAELWELYGPVLESGAFREEYAIGQYHLYERVR